MGTSLKYVEFVLHPEEIFKTFVEVADTVLEPIPNAGAQWNQGLASANGVLCQHGFLA